MNDHRHTNALLWKTSTRTQQNNQCVAVAEDDHMIVVRDTKNLGDGPILSFTHEQWERFIQETIEALPSNNRAVTVTNNTQVMDFPKRKNVLTRWHMQSLMTGETLHFDDGEWDAFTTGVIDGEFEFSTVTANHTTSP